MDTKTAASGKPSGTTPGVAAYAYTDHARTRTTDPSDTTEEPAPGLLGHVDDATSNPFNLEGIHQVRDQEIVGGAGEAAGPQELGYGGQRVAPTASATYDPVSQTYQGQRVGASQTQQFDPESGRYVSGPNRDFAGQGDSLEQATYQRGLNRIAPQMQKQRQDLAQTLANRGIPIGSEASNRELDRLDRSQSSARENLALSSVAAGRNEQGRLFGQELATSRFDSGEAGRQYGERLAGNQFNASEQGRGFRENLAGENQYFNQQFAGDQFESGERQFGANLNAQESARRFREGLASENQFFGQQAAGDQFAANQGQQGFNNRFTNQQFEANQRQNQFAEDEARRQREIQERLLLRQRPIDELSQVTGLSNQTQAPRPV